MGCWAAAPPAMFTGIVRNSVLMHKNSPVTHISAAHTRFITHLKYYKITFECTNERMDSELAMLVWLVVLCSTTGKPKGEEGEPEQNLNSFRSFNK